MTAPIADVVLTGGHVIDAVRSKPYTAAIVIGGDRIVAVVEGSAETIPARRTIELHGSYVLPGLWDAHTHLESRVRPAAPTVADMTMRYADQARRGLVGGGVVAVRTGGVPYFIDVAIRDAIAEGLFEGPRIFAGGYFLTTTAGHLAASSWSRECDGPIGFVEAIRDQIKGGVDHIKLNLSGGIMGPVWDQHANSYWLEDELDAAFDIAALRGFPVMAHATNPKSVKDALRAGAHSVEHGYVMDDECIELFLERGAWYVPTLCISHLTPDQAESRFERSWVEERALRADLVARADAAADEHRRWFQCALAAGVRMALGSDAGPLPTAVFQEMELWVKDGATPLQTIRAATVHAAELCGVDGDTGTLEVGKRADVIVVGANPLDDINNVRNVEYVLLGGRCVTEPSLAG